MINKLTGTVWALAAASLIAAEPATVSNPLVRVVTISQDGLRPGPSLVDATLKRLDQSTAFRPDIVCLPETFTRGDAEPVPGPTTKLLAEWARRNHCWVICPIKVTADGKLFNSAILIDRDGSIAGRYDKIHPTENELTANICPGVLNPPVFETDFGRIGIQICFDVNWRSQWTDLKQKGAQIIFFPSAYPAARQVRTLAWLNQCFVVSATMTRPASIYDISGDTIATTGKFRQWAGAVLPLGKTMFEIDFHVSKMRRLEAKYGDRVKVTWYHDDDLVSLASLDPRLRVVDLIDEFDLTPHSSYLRRAQGAQDERRVAVEEQ